MKLAAGFSALALMVFSLTPVSAQMPAFDPASFIARQKSLALRIDDALLAGRLSNDEANGFRNQLKTIADTEAKYKNDGIMSNWESVVLSFQLNGLSKKLEAQLTQRKVPSQNIDGMQVDINQRIDDAQDAGQFTDMEAMGFKEDLNRISNKEEKFRKSEGTLSEAEKLELSVDLDLLSKTVEDKLENRLTNLPNIDQSRQDLQNKIAQAKSAGNITEAQCQHLTTELARIYQLESDLRASEKRLTVEEAAILALEFEQVSNSLTHLTAAKNSAKPTTK